MADIEKRRFRFLTVQRRLKGERLFVKNEKEQLRHLNEKVVSLSQNLFHIEWKNMQQWNNVDRLITAKANPVDCSATSRFIDTVKFEDSYGHLNYEDSKYGQFILSLKENTKLVALILNYCDNKRIQTSARQLTNLMISTLYGNCTLLNDEIFVLKILKELMILQVFPCEDLLSFFCGKRSTENAFACLLSMFSEILFSSKLYLTAALHGTVMQVIVDDAVFLDYEVSKVLSRLTPKATLEKFGQPGTVTAKCKIKEHMKNLHAKLIRLCKKFLKSLFDKKYCFPDSLRWAIGQLYQGMLSKMKLPQANANAIIGYMLMSYFICPAIINPEPYGINSDADISETARYNLCQIASILKSLALLECGLQDEKLRVVLQQFEQNLIISYVSDLLVGSDIDISESNDVLSTNIVKSALLVTEHDLKTLINCLRLLQSYDIPALTEEGLDELLDSLPTLPSQWKKQKDKLTKVISMPTNTNAGEALFHPTLNARNTTPVGIFGCSSLADDQNKLCELREDLNTFIGEKEPVLVIQLGMQSDVYPGMLPEEKVLGLENNHNPSTLSDMDIAAYHQHSIVDNSFGNNDDDSFGNNDQINFEGLEITSSGSNCSIESELDSMIYNSGEIMQFDNSDSDSIFINAMPIMVNHPVKDASLNDIPIDILLDLNSDDEKPPALPEKKHTITSPGFREKRLSDESILSGDGELNYILQAVTLPSGTNDLSDVWTKTIYSTSDPWGPVKPIETTGESEGFENNFQPMIPVTKTLTPPPNIRYSLNLVSDYSEYAQNILQEQKLLSSRNMGEHGAKDELEDKLEGKRTLFMDKISGRLATPFRQNRMKNEGQLMKRDSFNDRLYRNLTQPQSVLSKEKLKGEEFSRSKSISLSTGSSSEMEDIGEAILEKYRKLKGILNEVPDTALDNLPQFDIDNPNAKSSEGDVVFDDEFNFDDAKKKLRSVLCKSDQSIITSDATSFDNLLITMLQGKLAEAINLQDRFSVAQYHEALRSIKQLPKGSCDNLIEQLENDYEQRTQYIAYLIQSRLGLLSTISHLEQLIAKLSRDKIICSKYFTTVSVRCFLESPEKKSEIVAFAQSFASNQLADEKCALLNEFLSNLHNQMLKDPTWMYCNEQQLEELKVATERAIISKIYKEAFHPNNIADYENDKIFHEHIKYLSQLITLSHPAIQIPKMYQKEAPWSSAQTELLMVNAYKTPVDKLACIHRCCITIMNLLNMACENHAPGADDFVPVLVYVILQANPPNLLSTKQYVNTFYETRSNGEEYYCWMQFCAALEFIKTIRTPNT